MHWGIIRGISVLILDITKHIRFDQFTLKWSTVLQQIGCYLNVSILDGINQRGLFEFVFKGGLHSYCLD
jgi:hypothetical protein